MLSLEPSTFDPNVLLIAFTSLSDIGEDIRSAFTLQITTKLGFRVLISRPRAVITPNEYTAVSQLTGLTVNMAQRIHKHSAITDLGREGKTG